MWYNAAPCDVLRWMLQNNKGSILGFFSIMIVSSQYVTLGTSSGMSDLLDWIVWLAPGRMCSLAFSAIHLGWPCGFWITYVDVTDNIGMPNIDRVDHDICHLDHILINSFLRVYEFSWSIRGYLSVQGIHSCLCLMLGQVRTLRYTWTAMCGDREWVTVDTCPTTNSLQKTQRRCLIRQYGSKCISES